MVGLYDQKEEKEEEQEDLELMEVEIEGKSYLCDDEENGILYDEDGNVELGKIVDGEVEFY